MPYTVLFFMHLPFVLTLEILLLALTIFVVVIPLVMGSWDKVSNQGVFRYLMTLPQDRYCYMNAEQCVNVFQVTYITPVVCICIEAAMIVSSASPTSPTIRPCLSPPAHALCPLIQVIVSFIVDRASREAFKNKKIIQFLAEQKERSLETQKEDQEELLYTIFPKVVSGPATERAARSATCLFSPKSDASPKFSMS